MDTLPSLDTGLERTTGLELFTFTDLQANPQSDSSRQWMYNTPYVMDQPVRNREHVRLLLASIDETFQWVTFYIPSGPPIVFAQAEWRGDGICVVEVNVPQGGWVRRVLHSGMSDAGDVRSENFGNIDMISAGEEHTLAEAFMICTLWDGPTDAP